MFDVASPAPVLPVWRKVKAFAHMFKWTTVEMRQVRSEKHKLVNNHYSNFETLTIFQSQSWIYCLFKGTRLLLLLTAAFCRGQLTV